VLAILSSCLPLLHPSSQAIHLANDRSYVLYDTRASFYEKLNCFNYALLDAKKTIDIAPSKWHGYFRSARLLAALGQSNAALQMSALALQHLDYGPKDESRRLELTVLRQDLESPPKKCPVSSVPVELLLVIFRLSNNPAIISHVCHRWREVAHSQPALWRSLSLTAPAEKVLPKIEEWNRRSRGRIVELTICESLTTALIFEDCAIYSDILAALRHLDLTELKGCHLEDVKAEPFLDALNNGTRFVHLDTLFVSTTRAYRLVLGSAEHDKLPWENLRILSVTNGRCDWAQLSMTMHCLTSFEYKIHTDNASVRDFHQFLQANPGLEKLVIEVVANYPIVFPTPQEPLTLANLHHLELRGALPFQIKSGNFSLPSLQILRVTWLQEASVQLSGLLEDETTSFAGLTELTTSCRLIGRQTLTSILRQAPKLKILNCVDIDSVVVESLSKPCTALLRGPASDDPKLVPAQIPILCPALNTLDLSWSPRLKTDPVVQIVKARITLAASQDSGRYQLPGGEDGDLRVSCIHTLKVDACPLIDTEMVPWFQEHVPEEFSCQFDLKRKRPQRGKTTSSAYRLIPSFHIPGHDS
jgi:F-box/TPR repeat protein Pof3